MEEVSCRVVVLGSALTCTVALPSPLPPVTVSQLSTGTAVQETFSAVTVSSSVSPSALNDSDSGATFNVGAGAGGSGFGSSGVSTVLLSLHAPKKRDSMSTTLGKKDFRLIDRDFLYSDGCTAYILPKRLIICWREFVCFQRPVLPAVYRPPRNGTAAVIRLGIVLPSQVGEPPADFLGLS